VHKVCHRSLVVSKYVQNVLIIFDPLFLPSKKLIGACGVSEGRLPRCRRRLRQRLV
jgi:hypothetical protein